MSHSFRYSDYNPVAAPRKPFIQADKYCVFNGCSAEYGTVVHKRTGTLEHPCGCKTVLQSAQTSYGKEYWIEVMHYCNEFKLARLQREREFYTNLVAEIDAEIAALQKQ